MTNYSFEIQELKLSSNKWEVDLHYESWSSPTKTIENSDNNVVLKLSEMGVWDSILKIDITDGQSKRTCIVSGIQGGTYLHKRDQDNNGQSVKIDNDNLILSLGLYFISIELNELKLNWKLKPDIAEVFEFYDLESDYLLHGEVGIHRIGKSGNVRWSFSATDIWVNIEGRKEVQIKDNTIRLIDYNSEEYEIDFNGKELNN